MGTLRTGSDSAAQRSLNSSLGGSAPKGTEGKLGTLCNAERFCGNQRSTSLHGNDEVKQPGRLPTVPEGPISY